MPKTNRGEMVTTGGFRVLSDAESYVNQRAFDLGYAFGEDGRLVGHPEISYHDLVERAEFLLAKPSPPEVYADRPQSPPVPHSQFAHGDSATHQPRDRGNDLLLQFFDINIKYTEAAYHSPFEEWDKQQAALAIQGSRERIAMEQTAARERMHERSLDEHRRMRQAEIRLQEAQQTQVDLEAKMKHEKQLAKGVSALSQAFNNAGGTLQLGGHTAILTSEGTVEVTDGNTTDTFSLQELARRGITFTNKTHGGPIASEACQTSFGNDVAEELAAILTTAASEVAIPLDCLKWAVPGGLLVLGLILYLSNPDLFNADMLWKLINSLNGPAREIAPAYVQPTQPNPCPSGTIPISAKNISELLSLLPQDISIVRGEFIQAAEKVYACLKR